MSDIKELVRGRELRATLAERDDLMRRLRGQHRAIRSGYLKGLFLAAADALEAMAGEVEQANVKATSMQRWIDHHNERADKAEAQVEALRGEVDLIKTLGVGAALETVAQKERAQKAEAEAARLKGALEALAGEVERLKEERDAAITDRFDAAAERIKAVTEERDRLKAALEKISNAQRRADRLVPIERSDGLVDWLEVHAFARKALGGGE